MGAEKFCLRWNDFETNLSSAFRDLRADNDLFDVTLSCGNDTLQAHKLVLSACSDMFRSMFRRPHSVSTPSSQGHTILYLRGVHSADMQAVLDFMYHGEVSVAQEELNSFLSVAEDLKVKGLTQKHSDNSTPSKAQYKEPKESESINKFDSNYEQRRNKPPEYVPQISPAPAKRPRPPLPTKPQPPPEPDVHEIQELIPVKTEPVQSAPYEQQVATMDNIENVEEQALDSYDGYAGYEDDGYQYDQQDGGQYADPAAKGNDGNVNLQDYITKVNSFDGSKFSCTLCGKQNNQKGNLMKHVESVHFPNSFSHACKYCDQVFNAKNSLYVHVSKSHNRQ